MSSRIELRVVVEEGAAYPEARTLVPGEHFGPIAVGNAADWRVEGRGVAPTALFLYFDGGTLHAASAMPGVRLGGLPLARTWTPVPLSAEIAFGSARILVRLEGSKHDEPATAPRVRPPPPAPPPPARKRADDDVTSVEERRPARRPSPLPPAPPSVMVTDDEMTKVDVRPAAPRAPLLGSLVLEDEMTKVEERAPARRSPAPPAPAPVAPPVAASPVSVSVAFADEPTVAEERAPAPRAPAVDLPPARPPMASDCTVVDNRLRDQTRAAVVRAVSAAEAVRPAPPPEAPPAPVAPPTPPAIFASLLPAKAATPKPAKKIATPKPSPADRTRDTVVTPRRRARKQWTLLALVGAAGLAVGVTFYLPDANAGRAARASAPVASGSAAPSASAAALPGFALSLTAARTPAAPSASASSAPAPSTRVARATAPASASTSAAPSAPAPAPASASAPASARANALASATPAASASANASTSAPPAPDPAHPGRPQRKGERPLVQRAVDAAAAGSYRDAALLYDALATENPGEPAYPEAARILRARAR